MSEKIVAFPTCGRLWTSGVFSLVLANLVFAGCDRPQTPEKVVTQQQPENTKTSTEFTITEEEEIRIRDLMERYAKSKGYGYPAMISDIDSHKWKAVPYILERIANREKLGDSPEASRRLLRELCHSSAGEELRSMHKEFDRTGFCDGRYDWYQWWENNKSRYTFKSSNPPRIAAKHSTTTSTQSNTTRDSAPTASEKDKLEVSNAIQKWSLNLYRSVPKETNLCMSPYSAFMALSLIHAGANGSSRAALSNALEYPGSTNDIHNTIGSLLHQHTTNNFDKFNELYGGILEQRRPPHELMVANSLWLENALPLNVDYRHKMQQLYRAHIQNLAFTAMPNDSASTINSWVNEATRGKISNLIAPDDLAPPIMMVLINAVYLNARWQFPFSEADTKPKPFYISARKEVSVPTMHKTSWSQYIEDDAVQVVELPYWSAANSNLSMLLILPRKRIGLKALENSLTTKQLDKWLHNMARVKVVLSMPKFKTSSTVPLNKPLKSLGLNTIFTPEADFSDISPMKLWVSSVLQKAWIRVDEKGTEAAAATSIAMVGAAPPPKEAIFKADHPFLYLIRDKRTGSIFFIGRVVNPKLE